MSTTVWKGTIKFGLVSVPVRLVLAAKENKVEVRMVNPATGGAVSQQCVDKDAGNKLERAQLSRAVTVDARTVVMTKQELDALELGACSELELVSFVRLAEVDPIHFSGSFYLLPAGDVDDTAYHLLAQALRGQGFAALGTFVRLGRRRNILIRTGRGGVLVVHTLYNAGEVREAEDIGPAPLDASELRLARRYVRERIERFRPLQLVDHYRQKLLELVAEKRRAASGDLKAELKSSVSKSARAVDDQVDAVSGIVQP